MWEVDTENWTRASDEENIEFAFKLIKHGCNILWHSGYDYDTIDCLQGIIDYYENGGQDADRGAGERRKENRDD